MKIYVIYEDLGIYEPIKYKDRQEAEEMKNFLNSATDLLFYIEEEDSE